MAAILLPLAVMLGNWQKHSLYAIKQECSFTDRSLPAFLFLIYPPCQQKEVTAAHPACLGVGG